GGGGCVLFHVPRAGGGRGAPHPAPPVAAGALADGNGLRLARVPPRLPARARRGDRAPRRAGDVGGVAPLAGRHRLRILTPAHGDGGDDLGGGGGGSARGRRDRSPQGGGRHGGGRARSGRRHRARAQREHALDAGAAHRTDRMGAHHVGHRRRARRHLSRQPGGDRPAPRAHAVGDLLLRTGLPHLDEQLQRVLQPDDPDHVRGTARHRHGDRHSLRGTTAAVQRHLPLRARRMSDRPSRLGGALRGLGLGALAGALWFTLEVIGNRLLGGFVPAPTLIAVAQLDIGLGALAGAALGALLPRGGLPLGLALAMVYGFLRVFEPPGMGAEAVFVLVAAVLVLGVLRLARRDGAGLLAFAHGTLLGALGVLGLETVLDQIHAHALRGVRLPIAIATLPALVVAADWLVGLVIRRRSIRLVIEAAAVLVACL